MLKQARKRGKVTIATWALERKNSICVQLFKVIAVKYVCAVVFVDIPVRLEALSCCHVQVLRGNIRRAASFFDMQNHIRIGLEFSIASVALDVTVQVGYLVLYVMLAF